MSRYIDADRIDIRAREGYDHDGVLYLPYRDVRKSLNSAPSIDIVRCKECRWNENTCINHGEMKPWCKFTDYVHTADDFCSYGERREP